MTNANTKKTIAAYKVFLFIANSSFLVWASLSLRSPAWDNYPKLKVTY
jgi:hypothetical protein